MDDKNQLYGYKNNTKNADSTLIRCNDEGFGVDFADNNDQKECFCKTVLNKCNIDSGPN